MVGGADSMRSFRDCDKSPRVMLMTEAAKRKVHIGSTHSHFGFPSFHLHTSRQLQVRKQITPFSGALLRFPQCRREKCCGKKAPESTRKVVFVGSVETHHRIAPATVRPKDCMMSAMMCSTMPSRLRLVLLAFASSPSSLSLSPDPGEPGLESPPFSTSPPVATFLITFELRNNSQNYGSPPGF